MDSWLKALVAAACVVVIVGGALYIYRDNHDAASAEAAEKERSMRAACREAERDPSLVALYESCFKRGYIRK